MHVSTLLSSSFGLYFDFVKADELDFCTQLNTERIAFQVRTYILFFWSHLMSALNICVYIGSAFNSFMRTRSKKKHGGCWECGRGTADTQQLLLKGSQHHAEATFSAKDLDSLNSIPVSPEKTLAAISDWMRQAG